MLWYYVVTLASEKPKTLLTLVMLENLDTFTGYSRSLYYIIATIKTFASKDFKHSTEGCALTLSYMRIRGVS